MKKGDSVRVKSDIMSPDYDNLIIGGWEGRIVELEDDFVTIELDSITLEGLRKDYVIDSLMEGLDYSSLCLERDEIEIVKPRDTQKDTFLKLKEINARYSCEEEEKRISDILKTDDTSINEENQSIYFEYLVKNIQKPCVLTGMEDFDWEEPYVLGGWSKKEYEKLKLNQPSYTDKFEFISFIDEIDDWKGIYVKVKRLSDNKKFELPLWDLKGIDEKSANFLLVSDYSSWMTNYR